MLLTILAALPQIISLLTTIIKFAIARGDAATILKQINDAFTQLSVAQTQEDYTNAAKAIANSIASFPGK